MNTFQRLQSAGLFSPRNVNNGHGKKPIYKLQEDRSTLIGWMNCFEANDCAGLVNTNRNKDAA